MRVFLILSLLFSAVICASLIHQSNESNLKEQASLLSQESKGIGTEQLNQSWSDKAVVPLNGNLFFISSYYTSSTCL